MKRIDTPTAVSGRFVDGNKTTGRKATQFSAEWCNHIAKEAIAEEADYVLMVDNDVI